MPQHPKLLFLACYFSPATTIACVRTWNLAKYLARLGWEVTIVTPEPALWKHVDNIEKTETLLKQEGIQRILTGSQWRCLMPHLKSWDKGLGRFSGGVCRIIARHLNIDSGIGWIKEAERACSTLTAQDVDLILATGSPFAAFRLAKRLSDRLGCPYVLDYRDLWTGHLHPNTARPDRLSTIREEARLLADCAAVTIVSPSWALSLERKFGLGSKLHVITNGYDPEDLANVKPYDFGHFAIVYTGTFYPPKRVISPLMAVLQHFQGTMNSAGHNWYLHYYGVFGDYIREEATKNGVMDRVFLHGRVPRTEALSAVRGANVAVVITSVAEEGTLADNGMVTGKVFEALGLGTPVLLVAPHGSDARAVVEATGLQGSFTGSDIGGMASFLMDMMDGRIVKPKVPEAYAWTTIGKKLDRVLRVAMRTGSQNEQEVRSLEI
jgi:glycosyltransferase involved in cell wall biosynthesis